MTVVVPSIIIVMTIMTMGTASLAITETGIETTRKETGTEIIVRLSTGITEMKRTSENETKTRTETAAPITGMRDGIGMNHPEKADRGPLLAATRVRTSASLKSDTQTSALKRFAPFFVVILQLKFTQRPRLDADAMDVDRKGPTTSAETPEEGEI